MGICPVRCRSNMSILENKSESAPPGTQLQHRSKTGNVHVVKMQQKNWAGFVPAAHEDTVTVSLCDYPAFGHIDPTMCIGERLTILSEWVTPLSGVSPSRPRRARDALFFPQQRRRLSDRSIRHDGPGELRAHHLHRQGDAHVSPGTRRRSSVRWGGSLTGGSSLALLGRPLHQWRQTFGTPAQFSPLPPPVGSVPPDCSNELSKP